MTHALDLLSQYGVLLVFAWVLLEQGGIPIPAYPLLVVAGSLAAEGMQSVLAIGLAAVCACLLADSMWYLAGRRVGRRVIGLLCKVSLSPDSCVQQTFTIFGRWGPQSLIFAKFVPGFASLATVLAATLGIPMRSFILYDAVGAALWSGSALTIGWVFGPAIIEVLMVLGDYGTRGLLLAASLLGAHIAFRLWRRRSRPRIFEVERLSVHDLSAMLRGPSELVVLDVRSEALYKEGHIPGALWFGDPRWSKPASASERDTLVVTYCACPDDTSATEMVRRLTQQGFTRAVPLLGGIGAWREANHGLEYGGLAPSDAAVTPSQSGSLT